MRLHQQGLLSRDFQGLQLETISIPEPAQGEVLIKVAFCGICHTEIDEIESRAPPSSLPMTLGHQVVGTVVAQGAGCRLEMLGKTVGVAWIFSACGKCKQCLQGLENLCGDFLASGRDRPGGYAEYMTAAEGFIHEIPATMPAVQAAPLLCAGAVGYRALRLSGLRNGESLGLTGFGSSGRLVLQMSRFLFPDSPLYVFARSAQERELALELGAQWAGDTGEQPPRPLNAAIDTTPAWLPVLSALAVLAPGGRLIINAIGKESGDHNLLTELDYARHLWREKSIKTVANVTRADVRALLALATRIPLAPKIVEYRLDQALEGLLAIKSGNITGSGVLRLDTVQISPRRANSAI
jgi:propanol-preferring alcohol dehydrogenase